MLNKIAAFEVRYQLKNPVVWVATCLFFLFAFSILANDRISVGSGGGNTHENGPFMIAQAQLILSVFYMFVTAAFVSNVIVRDDDTRFGPIVRSTRITKFDYLFGRFLGAVTIAAIGFLAIPLGLWLGSLMPWVDPETLGPNNLAYYLQPYLVLALPNIFVTGAIFFALATATRSMMATYLGVVTLLVLWVVIYASLAQLPEYQQPVAIGDPFGLTAANWIMRYWTVSERNSELVELSGLILWNRLLWIGIALAFLALAYSVYRFADKGVSPRQSEKERSKAETEAIEQRLWSNAVVQAAPRYDRATVLTMFSARARLEMRQVFRSPAFIVLMALGLFNAASVLWVGGDLYGTPTYPATFAVIPMLQRAFALIPIVVAIYYGGELVWCDRDRKMHEIIDSTPLPNWILAVPKILAVSTVLLATLLMSAFTAVLVQLLKGFQDLEVLEYLLWYLIPYGFDVILIAVLSVFVQAMSPSKYLGWGIMTLYIVSTLVFPSIGLEHGLFLYGQHPDEPLSAMNGAGIYWIAAWWFRLFWGGVAVILLVAAHLLWRRGSETRLKSRLRLAAARMRGTPGAIAGIAFVVTVASGGWIIYNTNVLNTYRTAKDTQRYQAEYERRYLRFEQVAQPSISNVVLNVALYPEDIRADITGRYRLTNLTGQPISEVYVRNPDRDLKLLAIDFHGAQLASYDEKFEFRTYRLDRPMAAGESRELGFRTRRQQVGFRNSGVDKKLVPNGTFLNNTEFAPAIGMDRGGLLQDPATRRKYGLPPEVRPARLEDPSGIRRNYVGLSWTTADITVSTVADQTPIAPGRKVFDRVEGGRRTARFVSDVPILAFFSVQSARYAEAHRSYQGVDLGVYYHPAHAWNVSRMLDAMQRSLDYFQANFGPYQFKQARIIEFPGYQVYAQAFANTMPYSEALGFLADNSNPDAIDYVSYVTAHEFGHQYWAHQIIGADSQGSTMLSETLAQYSALMVMKHQYGDDKIRRFLQFELDSYLRRRGGEGIEELPLFRVENQAYIHYNKGAVVMYLLQQRLGEAAVNRALYRLIEQYRFRSAPYPRSTDLIRLLREEARTPAQQMLITDLFELITVYDLRMEQASARQRPDGRWDVTLAVHARKLYADGRGVEREVPLNEGIEVGLFTAIPGRGAFSQANVLLMERRPIHVGRQVLRFVASRRPIYAGVDPYNFYIDRNSADNVIAVK
ncbi:ABC transporter permease/M1 family aminopeptidase [Sphingopyxis sp.]|uniref:ABC transporter permease/M1 family aminopeptidase n=1 Tax=Sphingopyxis sp. TaxID=1908224 RepID=UPI002B474B89|nr:M1 family aminopeptidase [Sphingopyxis sp.]HJS09785.1 M1 family aminopeptidase [Sphingopyxis sp.]